MNPASRWPWPLLKSWLSIPSGAGLTLLQNRILYNLSQIILSFFIFPCHPKSKVNALTCAAYIKIAYILSHFGYAMLPSFSCLIRNGLLFPENLLLQEGNEYICNLRILFPIKINHSLKLQKLQKPPAFHTSRQIQLSLWYRQINQGKVNYWLAQKTVNGRAENYTFKNAMMFRQFWKRFLP